MKLVLKGTAQFVYVDFNHYPRAGGKNEKWDWAWDWASCFCSNQTDSKSVVTEPGPLILFLCLNPNKDRHSFKLKH